MTAPVGVFDSGIGGLGILRALRAAMPGRDFVYLSDAAHAPYGERDAAFVVERSQALAGDLVRTHGAALVVVACNTATAAAIGTLRETFPGIPFVGIEPAVKPAVQATRTGTVGVLATRGTLASARFRALLGQCEGRAEIRVRACDGLADAIERGDEDRIRALCRTHTAALGRFGTAAGEIDTLVLGCTHYPFATGALRACVGDAVTLIDPGEAVARRASALLGAHSPGSMERGRLLLRSTGDADTLMRFADRWDA